MNKKRSIPLDARPRTAVWQWLLAGFSLGQLSSHLTGTVQDALQPEQVSLWLKVALMNTSSRLGEKPQ